MNIWLIEEVIIYTAYYKHFAYRSVIENSIRLGVSSKAIASKFTFILS